jgi:hypothetical protein
MREVLSLLSLFLLVLTCFSLAGEHIVGGTPYTWSEIPWGGSLYTAGRFQCCWYQSEIKESGKINKISFKFYGYDGVPPCTFTNVDMLLCHTNVSTLGSNFVANYGGNTPVNVFKGEWTLSANLKPGDWVIQCRPNFTYNNKDNLLLEISWEGRTSTVNGNFWRSDTGQPGRVWATSKTASTGTVYAGHGQIAYILMNFESIEPTSLGNIRTLFH